jgi:DNA-binding winged helix-turn-helix (wHTH) protein
VALLLCKRSLDGRVVGGFNFKFDTVCRGRVIYMGFAFKPVDIGREGYSGMAAAGLPTRFVRFGMFQLDLHRQELLKNGVHVKLQGKVYQALVALLENPGEIVTRETLRLRMWPANTHVNYDANVNTTVNKLRQVLGDLNSAPIFVETIPRKGYSFIAKVEYVDDVTAISGPRIAPRPQPRTSLWNRMRDSMFGGSELARTWFTAGVIALLIAAILFGAAITLFSRRAF